MSEPIIPSRIAQGFYPERKIARESVVDRLAVNVLGNLTRRVKDRPGRFEKIVGEVNARGTGLEDLSDEGLRARVDTVRKEVRTEGLMPDLAATIFALVRETAGRRIGLRHFDTQLIGGWVMLQGMVAEMETGEGKTLTATLPVCAAALAGIPVHVITVNDYLADRDARWMTPIYEAMGLSVGIIRQGMGLEERRAVYRCDITYCTNKEVVFDYLKDRLVLGQRPGHVQMSVERIFSEDARMDRLLLRGLVFAIVDEADSVLIDEARTPLIISGSGTESYEAQVYRQALEVVHELEEDQDFDLDLTRRSVDLTEQGEDRLEEIVQKFGGIWMGRQRREELGKKALSAVHLFERDRDYIVRDDKVQIVDEYTGRVMADRSWESGLHQLVEAKEECSITSQNITMARISYQRFFRRYFHLAGMTGTAREVADELWSVYRLRSVSVPTNRPIIRKSVPLSVYRTGESKWQRILERVSELHQMGRPILVGTRFVGTSEEMSKRLEAGGLPHRVLNARQDEEEAETIAQAGQTGKITVATNMAGRGTDISLGPGVKEIEGLHVLATELHDAKRIDRQLFGRCGRQGDPGSFEGIISLEDSLFGAYIRTPGGRFLSRFVSERSVFGRWGGRLFAWWVQKKIQNSHFQFRKDLLKFDESMEKTMAFSGKGE